MPLIRCNSERPDGVIPLANGHAKEDSRYNLRQTCLIAPPPKKASQQRVRLFLVGFHYCATLLLKGPSFLERHFF